MQAGTTKNVNSEYIQSEKVAALAPRSVIDQDTQELLTKLKSKSGRYSSLIYCVLFKTETLNGCSLNQYERNAMKYGMSIKQNASEVVQHFRETSVSSLQARAA